jgi:hypothetical protein
MISAHSTPKPQPTNVTMECYPEGAVGLTAAYRDGDIGAIQVDTVTSL